MHLTDDLLWDLPPVSNFNMQRGQSYASQPLNALQVGKRCNGGKGWPGGGAGGLDGRTLTWCKGCSCRAVLLLDKQYRRGCYSTSLVSCLCRVSARCPTYRLPTWMGPATLMPCSYLCARTQMYLRRPPGPGEASLSERIRTAEYWSGQRELQLASLVVGLYESHGDAGKLALGNAFANYRHKLGVQDGQCVQGGTKEGEGGAILRSQQGQQGRIGKGARKSGHSGQEFPVGGGSLQAVDQQVHSGRVGDASDGETRYIACSRETNSSGGQEGRPETATSALASDPQRMPSAAEVLGYRLELGGLVCEQAKEALRVVEHATWDREGGQGGGAVAAGLSR